MKRIAVAVAAGIIVCVGGIVLSSGNAAGADNSGEALFKRNCAVCHVDGGNIVNPQKTLHKKDRDANNIKTASDIIKLMRNPGPGMTTFDKKTIPDKEANKIADYILKTF
jgi:cytochrome c6